MYIIMTKEILDLLNVHTGLHQTCGIGVTELVRRDTDRQLCNAFLSFSLGDRPPALLLDPLPAKSFPLGHRTSPIDDAHNIPGALIGKMASI